MTSSLEILDYSPAAQTWATQAACRGVDGDLFFPISYFNPAGLAQIEAAVSVCRRCPVQRACLEDALDMEAGAQSTYRYGVRGGATPVERFNVYRSRNRRSQARGVA